MLARHQARVVQVFLVVLAGLRCLLERVAELQDGVDVGDGERNVAFGAAAFLVPGALKTARGDEGLAFGEAGVIVGHGMNLYPLERWNRVRTYRRCGGRRLRTIDEGRA